MPQSLVSLSLRALDEKNQPLADNSTYPVDLSVPALNDILDHARQLAVTLVDEDVPLPPDAAQTLSELNEALEAIPRCAYDSHRRPLSEGVEVVCTDASAQGDTDTEKDFLVAGKIYVIDDVYDDENLLTPMVTLKDTTYGPLFPERFVVLVRE